MRPTDHVKLVEEPDGTVALELDKVVPDDAGHYAVKAVNDKGETSSEADIKSKGCFRCTCLQFFEQSDKYSFRVDNRQWN